MRRPARLLAGCAAALALAGGGAGCGGDDPDEALRETAAKLGEIRSGVLDARMSVAASGPEAADGTVGFALRGPFALARRDGELPLARVDYTQRAGERSATVTLTATGREAFVTVDGKPYRLPRERAAPLRRAGGPGAARELRIDDWLRDPEIEDGGEAGGAEVDRIRARLHVAAAVNGLLGTAAALGGGAPLGGVRPIEGDAARELERAVERADVELLTGKEDRLLRRLTISIRFAVEAAGRDPELEALRGAQIDFTLAVDRPNSAVEVPAPAGARPFADLPAR